ncbi:PRTRC system protein A [Paenibacillus sp. yr247]|uniref:hypothetical protein n=1 Tax=Paenibacillus sp. yr247 TaxID=1761880 RepID=UPI000883CF6C|nr:hypothetical protein [Paenibacillus sp. yr247]SDO17983.1 PRTRC system protein A [Paenibacillus sp. yr247]
MKIKLRSFFWKLSDYLSSSHQSPMNIVASRDGRLYEVRETDFMRIAVSKTEVTELEDVQEGVTLKLPKIPGSYLATAVAFFRYYCEKEVEALVYIYWNRSTCSYELVCPEQNVNIIEVVSFIEPVYNPDRDIVMVIHSHHHMDAFFSPVDNRNDQAFRVYGVIGRLDLPYGMHVKFRAGYNGQHFEMDVKDLFEFNGVNSTTMFPEEWKERVHL